MPSANYTAGLAAILGDAVSLSTDTIKAVLLDMSAYGLQVTAATNATPIQISCGTHGLSTGDKVLVGGVGGNTNANGIYTVTVVNSTAFTLDGSTGNAAYTSGGYVVKLDADANLSDIPSAARSGLSAALGSKTFTGGAFDAADTTFTAVAAFASGKPATAFAVVKDTGTATTSTLLSISDRTSAGAAFSVTPNGGDINLQFDNGVDRIFKVLAPTGQAA